MLSFISYNTNQQFPDATTFRLLVGKGLTILKSKPSLISCTLSSAQKVHICNCIKRVEYLLQDKYKNGEKIDRLKKERKRENKDIQSMIH